MTPTSSFSASTSWTRESVQNLPRNSLGGWLQSVAHKSGLTRYPCWTRPTVYGNAPPPCAKQKRRRGKRSKTPPMSRQHMAVAVSAGIPENTGVTAQRLVETSWLPTHEPRQPVFRVSATHVHVPRVDEKGHVEILQGLGGK